MTAQKKTAQHGADGMGIRLLVPGSWVEPEAGPGCEGQKELGEEMDQLGLSQAQGSGPLESKSLRRTRLCLAMA